MYHLIYYVNVTVNYLSMQSSFIGMQSLICSPTHFSFHVSPFIRKDIVIRELSKDIISHKSFKKILPILPTTPSTTSSYLKYKSAIHFTERKHAPNRSRLHAFKSVKVIHSHTIVNEHQN